MGLLVAIPAQIAYNKFNIISSEIADSYKNITHETIIILSQEILVNEIDTEGEGDE
jgi:biopolymer transport protein ExbB/TolQ